MATRQDDIKAGTVEGAADRLAALRDTAQRDGLTPTDPPVDIVTEEIIEEIPEETEVSEEIQEETPEEVAPPEDDLFADELGEAEPTPDAPAALSKEGKDLFAKADPELQKAISERLAAAERGATQRVQQAAEKEKEAERLAQEVVRLRDEWNRKLESLDVNLPEPPDPDLADVNSEKYDPDQFNVQLARYERAKLDVERKKSERQKIAEENARLQNEQARQSTQQHAAKIVEYFPSWNTQEAFTNGVVKVQDWYAKEYGLSTEMVRGIIDSAAIKTGYMAMQYQAAKQKARGKTAPKASAPTGNPRTQPTLSADKARASLKQTGALNDAVAVLKATRPRR